MHAFRFPPPPGTRLRSWVGAGSTFAVAEIALQDGSPAIAKRPAPGSGEAGERALARETAVLRRIDGPGPFPQWVGDGRDPYGPWIVETRVAGSPLRWLVEQGRLPAARWRPVARRAFEALARLHELSRAGESLGAVHGDLSPDNVLVAGPPDDGVAFVDFGAASARGLGDATGRGTLPFADPEVVRGERAPDAAADVWALAATLVWAAGVRLVDAEDEPARLLEVAERGVRIERLRDVRGLASAAELRAMESALELDRARRTTSAREMARAFGAPW